MLSGLLFLLHDGGPVAPRDLWTSWTFQPAAAVGLLLEAAWYAAGVRRLRREAGVGRGLAWWAPWCFGAGLAAVALALFSPLDPLGETLFAAHMVQHLVLGVVAAPLLALGAPTRVMLWAFSPSTRRALGRWWHRRALLPAASGVLSAPATAWALSVAVLVFWHLPGPFEAALAHQPVHALEHLGFLGAGLLFWWVLVRPDRARRLGAGLSVLYVFAAGLPTGLLGALLTFAGRPLYSGQSAAAPLWGLTPLGDQQLAGMIMWMPGGLVYFAAAAVLFVGWLREEEQRSLRRVATPVWSEERDEIWPVPGAVATTAGADNSDLEEHHVARSSPG